MLKTIHSHVQRGQTKEAMASFHNIPESDHVYIKEVFNGLCCFNLTNNENYTEAKLAKLKTLAHHISQDLEGWNTGSHLGYLI